MSEPDNPSDHDAGDDGVGRPRPRPAIEGHRRPAAPEQEPVAAEPSRPGNALVSAARVGRLLGRSGWRLARQLPGVAEVEQLVEPRARRLLGAAGAELARRFDPPSRRAEPAGSSPEEQRVSRLVQGAQTDPDPLRTAMGELLDRARSDDADHGQDYLFGTIVSQLVPDEARILATLAGGRPFAAIDVQSRRGRTTRTVLANASTVGAAANVARLENVPTYLNRLQGYGLVAFADADDALGSQYDRLSTDQRVRAATAEADRRRGSARIVRKTVVLTPLGRDFWAASAPGRRRLGRDER